MVSYYPALGVERLPGHTTMMLEDFVIKTSPRGVQYIAFDENPTKTRNGGLKGKKRKTKPKMFATGGERCPVCLFRLYVSKRPPQLRTHGRFYLTPIKDKSYLFRNDCYINEPMGKNKVLKIKKNMITDTEVVKSTKNISNHSARKTLVRKLKSA